MYFNEFQQVRVKIVDMITLNSMNYEVLHITSYFAIKTIYVGTLRLKQFPKTFLKKKKRTQLFSIFIGTRSKIILHT